MANDAPFLTPEMYGAKGNGSTDDTTALSNFFTALQISGLEGRLGGRTYNVSVSGGFTITKPIKLSGVGSQLSIIHNTNASAVNSIINLEGSPPGSVLRDFGLSSVSGAGTGSHGIYVTETEYFVLENIAVSGVGGAGIYVVSATAGAWIKGCFIHNTGTYGIVVTDPNLTVESCYVGNVGSHGFYFPTSAGNAGLTLKGCTAFDCGTSGTAYGFYFNGSSGATLTNVIVSDCTASTNSYGSGFYFNTYGKCILLSNCYCETTGYNGSLDIVTANVPGITFTSNNNTVTVTGCQVVFSSGSGIDMECSFFAITGGYYVGNCGSGNAESAGILVGVTGSQSFLTITGVNTFAASDEPNRQPYGINIYTSGSGGIVSGCALYGTTSAYQANGVTFANNFT